MIRGRFHIAFEKAKTHFRSRPPWKMRSSRMTFCRTWLGVGLFSLSPSRIFRGQKDRCKIDFFAILILLDDRAAIVRLFVQDARLKAQSASLATGVAFVAITRRPCVDRRSIGTRVRESRDGITSKVRIADSERPPITTDPSPR